MSRSRASTRTARCLPSPAAGRRAVRPLCLAAGVSAVLVGCSQTWDADAVRAMPRPAGDFEAALFEEYVGLAEREQAEEDWRAVDDFLSRAEELASGRPVDPEAIADRDLATETALEMTAARDRLLDTLRRGGRVFAPTDAAAAQAAFDCWMQEVEEGHQRSDIRDCRRRFERRLAVVAEAIRGDVIAVLQDPGGRAAAIEIRTAQGTVSLDRPDTAALIGPATGQPSDARPLDAETIDSLFGEAIAAQPLPPDRFVVYFETGTSELTPASVDRLTEVVAAIARRAGARVEVVGHADRVGPEPLNAALSLRRAQLVRDRLRARIPADVTLSTASFGERDPRVPTADGVAEPLNRRVEITVR